MIDLRSQRADPFPSKKYLGIVISGSRTQRHTGLIVRCPKAPDGVFIHLAFHFQLSRESIPENIHWLPVLNLDPEEQRAFAIWCHKIWEINGHKIPYGINFSESKHFNNDGAFTASFDDGGLTCATFVLALFEDYALPVIDVATSYRRPDDEKWQAQIIDILTRLEEVTPEYIDHQRDFIGQAVRYRPEEVAGAVSTFEDPLSFQMAIDLGTEVILQMENSGAFNC